MTSDGLPSSRGGFANVDEDPEPPALISILDGIANTTAVRSSRDDAIPLLELRAGDEVLDVGCGLGHDVPLFLALGAKVTGVDSSETFIKEASRRHGAATFLRADALALPFDAASFHALLLNRVLMHVRDPQACILEAARVLKPSGRMVIVEPLWERMTFEDSEPTGEQLLTHIRTTRLRDVSTDLSQWVTSARLQPGAIIDRSFRVKFEEFDRGAGLSWLFAREPTLQTMKEWWTKKLRDETGYVQIAMRIVQAKKLDVDVAEIRGVTDRHG